MSSTAPRESVSRSEEEKLKKRTSEVALSATIMEETKINKYEYTWIADWFTRCHVTKL